jgi:hypothetical protein
MVMGDEKDGVMAIKSGKRDQVTMEGGEGGQGMAMHCARDQEMAKSDEKRSRNFWRRSAVVKSGWRSKMKGERMG